MDSEKSAFLPIRPVDETDDEDFQPSHHESRHKSKKNMIIAILSLTQLCTLFLLAMRLTLHHQSQNGTPGLAQTRTLPLVYNRFAWNTPYSVPNDTEADLLWSKVATDHGVIAVDRNWASGQRWPKSLTLPGDESKHVYLLAAYHQMHCVKKAREIFFKSVRQMGNLSEHDLYHIRHCFDALRQAIQCNADNTPLYTFADHTVGVGQLIQCRDWNALRGFGTKHSACYQDPTQDPVSRLPFSQRFGHCDSGDDGLLDLASE